MEGPKCVDWQGVQGFEKRDRCAVERIQSVKQPLLGDI
jgi:hypothetical protein